MEPIADIVKKASDMGVSDIHIVCGLPVRGRLCGNMMNLTDSVLTHQDCEEIARELAGDDYSRMETIGELDFAKSLHDTIRTRLSLFRQQGSVSAAIRILNDRIPLPQELGLPEVVQNLANCRNGLVLVTGETGSGKSTTLASLLNQINHQRNGHILTLEDPIEYVYTPDLCVVNQREIGNDTRTYSDGLRSVLREDPDVILIGEMRDLDTMESALTAAETGHLVFSTLHTNSAADTIDRVVSVFPDGQQRQIRTQLAGCLRAVIAQQLLPSTKENARVASFEVMIVNNAIRNLIREGKSNQIDSFIGLGAQEGSISMDAYIAKLLKEGKITRETAERYARNPVNLLKRQ